MKRTFLRKNLVDFISAKKLQMDSFAFTIRTFLRKNLVDFIPAKKSQMDSFAFLQILKIIIKKLINIF